MLGQRSRSKTELEPPPSPPRKRPRHSDPSLGSQSSQPSRSSQLTKEAKARRDQEIAAALHGSSSSGSLDSHDDGIAEHRTIQEGAYDNLGRESASPPPEEPNYDDWFAPSSSQAVFVPASQLPEAANLVPHTKRTWKLPTKEALEQASQRLDQWSNESDVTIDSPDSTDPPQRQVLGALDNTTLHQHSDQSNPSFPTKRASDSSFRTPLLNTVPQTPSRPDRSPANQGFRAPSLSLKHGYQNSPLNPNIERSQSNGASSSTTGFTSAAGMSSTPRKLGLGMTPRARINSSSRPTFVTPFKKDRKPSGESSPSIPRPSSPIPSLLSVSHGTPVKSTVVEKRKEPLNSVFDLSCPEDRFSMRKSGIVPGAYKLADLSRYSIPHDITTITIRRAPYYRFQGAPEHPDQSCGVDTAYDDLLQRGCDLLPRLWVDNHWGFVLWKLASLVCCSPDLFEAKWNYPEVLRQLLYRYEREINRAQRPPLRLITERDTSSAKPLVLCVSDVIATGGSRNQSGGKVPLPMLEVTDGWYKLRASIDECLARAVGRGVIAIGTKIAISGARLEGAKDGMEPLKAYDRLHLALTGNSTSLARWDTKLGFQPRPFIATLRSLSPDGGPVMLMDIVVTKVFPVGYVDMNGDRTPKCEAEEREAAALWKTQYENEEAKLQSELEKKVYALEGLAERLAARGISPSADADPPGYLEDLFEELEESNNPTLQIKDLVPHESGWLARIIRNKCVSMRETARDLIARELESRFPPRNIRNFRVIRFKDYQTKKHQPTRTGQLTVWDVLSLGENAMVEGKRYLVTNIVPSQPKAWQRHDREGEACFNTRKDSRWISPTATDS
ncbi:hypothetical protein FRC02_003914 [Tulasnella sp. 418]|nr:hypothetical protein FRC02_003914 [Tulasnella sp. 418]